MNLIAASQTGTQLEPSVISSARLSAALVTGASHIFNNAVLSHSAHSKLAKENYTTEHSTRQTHTNIRHLWQLTLEEQTAPLSPSAAVSGNAVPGGWTFKDPNHIRVSRFRTRFTINTFQPLSWDITSFIVKRKLNDCGHKILSHEPCGTQRLNIWVVSHCTASPVQSYSECVRHAVTGD